MELVETPGYDHSAEDEVKPEAWREQKWRATLNLEPAKPTKGRKGSIVRTGLPIDAGKLAQQAVEAAVSRAGTVSEAEPISWLRCGRS